MVRSVIATETKLGNLYDVAVVSGAVVRNIVSGNCSIHSLTLNNAGSGYSVFVFDSSSGAIVGREIMCPFYGDLFTPTTLLVDGYMYSGLVVATSGANWRVTVSYTKLCDY